MSVKKQTAVLSAALLAFATQSAQAYILSLPGDLAHEVLSESVPTAFSINEFGVEDFVIEWAGTPVNGVQFSLGAKSFEWVRVVEATVLPRAQLILTALDAEGGRLSNAGFSQPLKMDGKSGRAEMPVALISGEKNPIRITLLRDGREVQGELRVRFKPRPHIAKTNMGGGRVYYDPSCSRFGLSATSKNPPTDDWVYIGCRLVYVEGARHRTSNLETYVYWDNVGQNIQIQGVDTPSTLTSFWPTRLRANAAPVTLKAGNHEIAIHYYAADPLHFGGLSMGVGPYSYRYAGPGEGIDTVTLMPTIYSSFFVTEAMRVVAFGAAAFGPQLMTDLGVYLNTEYVRVIDRRLIVNLMLGAHVIGFRSQGTYYVPVGAPQGAEVIVVDAFSRGKNLSLGGFVYPLINGRSYVNTWVRWGSGALFGEINYISWDEKIGEAQFSSRSVGVTVGFPLMRFF